VQVKFVNDGWDGTPNADGHDRNVYVGAVSLNGTTIQGQSFASDDASAGMGSLDPHAAVMLTNGTTTYTVPADPPASGSTGSGGSTGGTATGGTAGGTAGSGGTTNSGLTLQVSGDMYNGDPQIQVFVDGQQVGNAAYDITAHHSLGQTQTIQIAGNFDPTVAHQVQVKFVNDAWDGTPNADGHDRNVYVGSVSLNGTTIQGQSFVSDDASAGGGSLDPHAAVMLINGTTTYTVAGPGVPSSGTSSGTGHSTVGSGAGAPPSGPGFFVSPTGSDSNPGTLAAPFATLARAQQAMENSSLKTTYVEGGTYHLSSTLNLTSADNGETWQYYPANGVDSAVLDGGNNIDLININGASNVTINGLKLQHFNAYGIAGSNTPNLTVENCDVGFNVVTSWQSAAMVTGGTSPNVHFLNNYVHDVGSQGIALFDNWSGAGGTGSIDGSVISGNVVLRAVQRMSDGGGIYVSMHGGSQNSHVAVSNNYVADYGAPGVNSDNGIYLDDNASNVTVTGNVVAPPQVGAGAAFVVHNGHDNHISGNLVDLGQSATTEYAAVWWGDGPFLGGGMQGNSFTGNVVISNFAGNQNTGAFLENQGSSSDYTIQNNVYYNYGGGQTRTDGAISSDSHPIFENPQISGLAYGIAAGSPVFSGPVSFSQILAGWGPPGFIVPNVTSPSSPH
jgi:hypothetical protein